MKVNVIEDQGEESMADKTGLYVFTGFLGAGKTTILLRLLDILKDKRVGIIQNEFGKLSIDGEIYGMTISKWWKLTGDPFSVPASDFFCSGISRYGGIQVRLFIYRKFRIRRSV